MAKKKENPLIEGESSVININVENIDAPDDNIEIYSKTQQYSVAMYLDKNYDTSYFSKFIKGVEKAVRGNEDYKLWLESLRSLEEYSNDAFLANVSSSDAEIQLHHHPFNLYTICSVVTREMLDRDLKVSTFIVADTVIRRHLKGHIGLVPLAVTMHNLAHMNQLNILRTQIIGHWEEFYESYTNYFSEYEIEVVRSLINTKALNTQSGIIKQLGTHNTVKEELNVDEEQSDE